MGIRGIASIFCLIALLAASARGQDDVLTDLVTTASGVATFENFSEGASFKPTLTDPLSNIVFSSSTAVNHNFVVEYANQPSVPAAMFQNNKYLSANGYSPGNVGGLAGNFGFTATLPQPAQYVELDLAGTRGSGAAGAYGVSLLALDTTGAALGSQTVSFGTVGLVQQYHLRVDAPDFTIAKFMLTTSDEGADGVDNIYASVPEPTTTFAATAMILAIGTARRKPRR
jgi:hypothetical protein